MFTITRCVTQACQTTPPTYRGAHTATMEKNTNHPNYPRQKSRAPSGRPGEQVRAASLKKLTYHLALYCRVALGREGVT
jgi:hypothetical protein